MRGALKLDERLTGRLAARDLELLLRRRHQSERVGAWLGHDVRHVERHPGIATPLLHRAGGEVAEHRRRRVGDRILIPAYVIDHPQEQLSFVDGYHVE